MSQNVCGGGLLLFIAVVIPEGLHQHKTVVVVCQWAILSKSDGAYHGQDGKKEAVEQHLRFFLEGRDFSLEVPYFFSEARWGATRPEKCSTVDNFFIFILVMVPFAYVSNDDLFHFFSCIDFRLSQDLLLHTFGGAQVFSVLFLEEFLVHVSVFAVCF